MLVGGSASIFRVREVDFRVGPEAWDFALANAAEIEAHWARRTAENRRFFNGTVFVLASHSLSSDVLAARFVRTDFKSFLFWRETGWRDASTMDAFGSGLILSPDGNVLHGRQRAGNLNQGLTYPPGGFIDVRDVDADGRIDIDGSVAREIAEETGLGGGALERLAGYVITWAPPVLAIGVPFRSLLAEAALIERTHAHIGRDGESELERVLFLAPGLDTRDLAMPDYARVLLAGLVHLKSPA